MDKTASFLYKAFIRKYLKQTKQTKKKKLQTDSTLDKPTNKQTQART